MRIIRVLLSAWTVVIGVIVWWPTPVDRPVAGAVKHVVSEVQRAGVSGFSYSTVEITSNVVMFVPLGLLLVLAVRRLPWWWAVVVSVAFSTTIELVQLAFLPDRLASVVDVAANALGGTLGALAAWAISALVRLRANAQVQPG